MADAQTTPRRTSLPDLVRVFLKLGLVGFGGPAVHIGMLEDDLVVRRKWLTREQLLDLMGAVNLIPGPNSTEMCIHLGYRQRGWLGMLVAGGCFIVPAVLMTTLLAWAYVRFGSLPRVEPFLLGCKPAVLAVILAAIWRLGRTAVKGPRLLAIGVGVAAAVFLGAGALGMLWLRLAERGKGPTDASRNCGQRGSFWSLKGSHRTAQGNALGTRPPPGVALKGRDRGALSRPFRAFRTAARGPRALPWAILSRPVGAAEPTCNSGSHLVRTGGALAAAVAVGSNVRASAAAQVAAVAAGGVGVAAVSLWKLGLFFLKIGAVLYGTGYVLVAFLEGGLVQDYGWLTRRELLDAIAAGQFTPGPLLSTSAFVGYVVSAKAGLSAVGGAAIAAAAVFLPSFLFVVLLNPILPRLRQSRWSAAFLDAVNVSAVALMVAVVVNLGRTTLVSWPAWVIALLAGAVAIRWRVNTAWLILGGAALGWLLAPWAM